LAGPKVRTSEVVTPGPGSRVHRDDRILLTRGTPAGAGPMPFQAACSIPAILDQLSVGAPVWIDDGKIGARVEALRPEGAVLVVTQTGPRGARLAPDKGLNFPDTDLCISPLTERDLVDLDFVARQADLIGYSFVQDAADVELLQGELRRRLPEP